MGRRAVPCVKNCVRNVKICQEFANYCDRNCQDLPKFCTYLKKSLLNNQPRSCRDIAFSLRTGAHRSTLILQGLMITQLGKITVTIGTNQNLISRVDSILNCQSRRAIPTRRRLSRPRIGVLLKKHEKMSESLVGESSVKVPTFDTDLL